MTGRRPRLAYCGCCGHCTNWLLAKERPKVICRCCYDQDVRRFVAGAALVGGIVGAAIAAALMR